MEKSHVQAAALAVIPVVLIILAFSFVRSLGGFDDDPEYAYLLNSLMILKLQLPFYFWHPGTTLHLLGAGVIALVWFARWPFGHSGLQFDVLQHPELYLRCINAALVVAIGVACFLLGWCLRSASKSLAIGVIGQAVVLTSYPALSALSRVSPEPLLLCLSMLLVAILAPQLIAPEPRLERRPLALLAGATVAACVATKLTAIPLVFMLLLLGTVRMQIVSGIAAVITFIVLTLPIAPHYHSMMSWFANQILRNGFYGSGEVAVPSLGTIAYGVGQIATAAPELIVALAGCLIMLLCAPTKRVFAVCAIIIAVQIAVVAKEPRARYLLPATAAVMMAVAVAAYQLMGGSSVRRMATLTACGLVLGVGVWRNTEAMTQEIRIHSVARGENRALMAQFATSGCDIIPYYNAIESTEFKLAYGDWWAGGTFGVALAEIYPEFLTYRFVTGHFETYEKQLDAIEARTRLAREKCVYLVGSPIETFDDNMGIPAAALTKVAATGRDLGLGYSLAVYQLHTDLLMDSN